jgi:hypothetical protein
MPTLSGHSQTIHNSGVASLVFASLIFVSFVSESLSLPAFFAPALNDQGMFHDEITP